MAWTLTTPHDTARTTAGLPRASGDRPSPEGFPGFKLVVAPCERG